jgi:hypothetical protein
MTCFVFAEVSHSNKLYLSNHTGQIENLRMTSQRINYSDQFNKPFLCFQRDEVEDKSKSCNLRDIRFLITILVAIFK